jgi:hypothetical protein
MADEYQAIEAQQGRRAYLARVQILAQLTESAAG